MLLYIFRRILYAIPILFCINLLTFLLFFTVNSPDDMARMQLGEKHLTQQSIDNWKKQHGYHKPLFYNDVATSFSGKVTETIFYNKSISLFWFEFGLSDSGRKIAHDVYQRMWPSLAIALPTFLLGLIVNISLSLSVAFLRFTKFDSAVLALTVVLMSISSLFYIIGGQYLVAYSWQLLPVSGYSPTGDAWKFVLLPIILGVLSGIGAGLRWYRVIFLEEAEKDYIRFARSKGLTERAILFKHLLRNALLPVLTGVVVVIPLLFMGSLIMEAFFSIPGLGSYTIDAIYSQDFSILRTMVFIGSVLYIIGLILTDIAYAWADPRVRLN